jgi:hypothetical protein
MSNTSLRNDYYRLVLSDSQVTGPENFSLKIVQIPEVLCAHWQTDEIHGAWVACRTGPVEVKKIIALSNSFLSPTFPGRMQTYPPAGTRRVRNHTPPAFGLRNIAVYDLIRSRRRSFSYSGPVPHFSKIMTSKIRAAGEMRYNRAHCRLRCTRIPAGFF